MISQRDDYAKKYARINKSSPAPKILAVLILALALIAGTAIYSRQQSEYQRQVDKREQLLEQYNRLRSENIAIEGEINSIDSDEYVQRMASEVLGMVWPNQVVFMDGDEQAGNPE